MLEPGQLVLLISPKGKRYMKVLDLEKDLHTQEGILLMADVAKADYGTIVHTHLGRPFRVVRPTLSDMVKGVRRQTQVLYPKDIGYLLVRLGIGAGKTVIEAGSGSGSLTVALSHTVGNDGRVFTYERRPEFAELCRSNLDRYGLGANVTQVIGHDVAEGFVRNTEEEGTRADALFLDVRTPWEYVHLIPAAIKPGSPVAFLLPTISQVSDLLKALEAAPFADLEVAEILVRRWKTVPDRMRPDDRMVAHTGFLVFARHQEGNDEFEAARPLGTRERKQQKAREKRLAAEAAKNSDAEGEGNQEESA
ncbi:tRNA (adenine-N1)-methyltransferase [Desulfobaculum bizertense]|uniref:tRNA (adenine(58)-N(1))-methyltransferase TrmI n=1 Tax=Desulfobaculum bizertense DSM 18034 TaxID=1121442 RepID=A0A1T4VIB7_9BACT|nr:tRNA (adenine-N1)-methyltransferase [Desulfobaculum bizertense]UIJ37905.1 tRNA (adenine-N1)-methyltransferase [Desulfobaculum bizertense]SKA64677.1 tRNA (adenine57-N1/adenine58-N1)-methyltransferase [Desulfobaculum bizertense DSM 18034]